jgi:TrmH family RNA methyltransferase
VAEGIKIVSVALDHGAPVESLFVAQDAAEQAVVADLVDRALAAGARVFDLAPGVMEKVADTVTPQPVLAVVGDVSRNLEELLSYAPRGGGVVFICTDVRDPGNLGALIRSGAAAGVGGVVCCEGTVDPFSPKTVRASAGAIFEVPIAQGAHAAGAIEGARSNGFRVLATAVSGGVDYATADLSGDVALVFGNEASGLDPALLAQADESLTIPMADGTESLNVAMTGTILAFEAARRRRLS